MHFEFVYTVMYNQCIYVYTGNPSTQKLLVRKWFTGSLSQFHYKASDIFTNYMQFLLFDVYVSNYSWKCMNLICRLMHIKTVK